MKLIVFDCDGTLADSQHAIFTAMTRAFEAHDLPPPDRASVLAVVGLSLEIAIAEVAGRSLTDGKIQPLAESYKLAFQHLRRDPNFHEPLFPGIRDLLARLAIRDDVLIGVATGKSMRGLRALLEREDLIKRFATLQTADNHASKPDPEMLVSAMNETGCEPDQTVMVGDTTFDMEMAKSAGVHALGVNWGYHPADILTHAGAIHMATTADEIETLSDALLKTKTAA